MLQLNFHSLLQVSCISKRLGDDNMNFQSHGNTTFVQFVMVHKLSNQISIFLPSSFICHNFVFPSAFPMSCISGCSCYYSVDHEANTMDCSFNNMTTLPEKLLPGTELLVMTGNNLGNLDSVPENFPEIKQLDLNGSNIKTISDEAFNVILTKTDKLYLSNNKLGQVPYLLQEQKIETQLWLTDNLFDCDCDMMWMRDWLLNATNVVEKEKIICTSGKWKGVYMPSFSFEFH